MIPLERWKLVQYTLENLIEKKEQHHLRSRGEEGPSTHACCSVGLANIPAGGRGPSCVLCFRSSSLSEEAGQYLYWLMIPLGKETLLTFCTLKWSLWSAEIAGDKGVKISFKKQRQQVGMSWTSVIVFNIPHCHGIPAALWEGNMSPSSVVN